MAWFSGLISKATDLYNNVKASSPIPLPPIPDFVTNAIPATPAPVADPVPAEVPVETPVVSNPPLVTEDILKNAFPAIPRVNRDILISSLNDTLYRFSITSNKRISAFLGQVAHESVQFTARIENLNYSIPGLRSTFGSYFPNDTIAAQYARKPEAIANRVYANRMGNGDEASGDGWKYRGKGYIQVTGKDNTTLFASYVGKSVDDALDYLMTVEGAILSAGWFWDSKNLNTLADSGDITGITKRINGGTNGLADRVAFTSRVAALLPA